MEGKQNIYYALGILAYAIAKCDGKIQHEEKDILSEIVKEETDHNIDFEYAEIAFQLLARDNMGIDYTYNWAMTELEKGRHFLSPEIKDKMVNTLIRISQAIDKVTQEEIDIIERFKKDIENLGSEHYLK